MASKEAEVLAGLSRALDDFMANQEARTVALEEAAARPGLGIFGNQKERQRYSFCNLLRASIDPKFEAGFEREVSDEVARVTGRETQGLFVPYEALVQPRAAISTTGTGANVVFETMASFIELLRKKSRAVALGAQMIPGLQGNVAFPRQTTAGVASWVAEAPGTDLADSDLALDQVSMAPKQLQSTTTFSRLLAVQSTPGAEGIIRDDLAAVHGLAIDLAAINGAGGSNEPLGILNTSGIGDVAIGANGGAPTYVHAVELEEEVEQDDAEGASMGYLSSPGVKRRLKLTEEFASTSGRPVWTGGVADGRVNGHPAMSSNQVPQTLTKGTSSDCHAVIYGDWSSLLIGQWGPGFEVILDPYSLARRNLIRMTSWQAVDIAVRHAASFAAIKDARPNA